MSTSRTARARVPGMRLRDRVRRLHGTVEHVPVGSAELAACLERTVSSALARGAIAGLSEVRARQALDHAKLVVENIAACAGAAAFLETISPQALTSGSQLLAQADALLATGECESALATATAAHGRFRDSVDEGVDVLRKAERETLAGLSVAALTNLGYTVRLADGEISTAIVAERRGQVTGLLIGDGGSLDIDQAGCVDGSCVDATTELLIELGHLGVEVDEMTRVDHLDEGGGALLRRAGAVTRSSRSGMTLERAMVDQFEKGRPEEPPRDPGARAVERRSALGSAQAAGR